MKKRANDAKDSAHFSAIKALGEVAKSCPMVRTEVDGALQRALANPKSEARHAAVQALFHCGARTSNKTKTILDDLKDDPEIKVRESVAVSLKEISRQHAVVSQLDKVGILEGKQPLYRACFDSLKVRIQSTRSRCSVRPSRR